MKTVKLKRSEDLVLDIPEGFAEPGEKVSITEHDGSIVISKMVPVEVDLDDETFLQIAKLAHEKDLTFNEMCNIVLEEQLEKIKNSEIDKAETDEKPYDSEMY